MATNVKPSAVRTLAKWRVDVVVKIEDSRFFRHLPSIFAGPRTHVYLDEKVPPLHVNSRLMSLNDLLQALFGALVG